MTETTPEARAMAQILAEDAANERDLGLLRQTHANGFKGGVRHCANILRAALSPPAVSEAGEAEREGASLVKALDDVLASCGARGRFHALECHDAYQRAETLLASLAAAEELRP